MGVDVLVLLPPSADPRRGGLSICHFTLALSVLVFILLPDGCGCSFSCIAEKFEAIAARASTGVLMSLTLFLKQFEHVAQGKTRHGNHERDGDDQPCRRDDGVDDRNDEHDQRE